MDSTANTVNRLLNTLEEEDLKSAITFIEYLSQRRKQYKEVQIRGVFDEFQNIIENDKGWDCEEMMLEDMAKFRRERLGI